MPPTYIAPDIVVPDTFDGTCSSEETGGGSLADWLKRTDHNGFLGGAGIHNIQRIVFPTPVLVTVEAASGGGANVPSGATTLHVTASTRDGNPYVLANAGANNIVGKRLSPVFAAGEKIVIPKTGALTGAGRWAVDPTNGKRPVVVNEKGLVYHTKITGYNAGTGIITFTPAANGIITAGTVLRISNRYRMNNGFGVPGRHHQEWTGNGCEFVADVLFWDCTYEAATDEFVVPGHGFLENNQVGLFGDVKVANATVDQATGVCTVTTETAHNLLVGEEVSMNGLDPALDDFGTNRNIADWNTKQRGANFTPASDLTEAASRRIVESISGPVGAEDVFTFTFPVIIFTGGPGPEDDIIYDPGIPRSRANNNDLPPYDGPFAPYQNNGSVFRKPGQDAPGATIARWGNGSDINQAEPDVTHYRISFDGVALADQADRFKLAAGVNGTPLNITRDGSCLVSYGTLTQQFIINGCDRFVVRDLSFGGRTVNSPTALPFYATFALQNCINIGNLSSNIEMDNCYFHHPWGDMMQINGYSNSLTENLNHIWVHHCYGYGSGRHGITPADGDDIIIEHNYLDEITRSVFDSEMDTMHRRRRIFEQYNTIGSYGNGFVVWSTAFRNDQTLAEYSVCRYNHGLNGPLDITALSADTNPPNSTRHRYAVVEGNTSVGTSGAPRIYRFLRNSQIKIGGPLPEQHNELDVGGAPPPPPPPNTQAAVESNNLCGFSILEAENDWNGNGIFHARTNNCVEQFNTNPVWYPIPEPVIIGRDEEVVDTTDPTIPGTPNAIATAPQTIQITFAASTDPPRPAGSPILYEIFRDNALGLVGSLTSTSTTTVTFTEGNLTAGNQHFYRVWAKDLAPPPGPNKSVLSPPSNTVTVTGCADTSTPSIPQNVSAVSTAATPGQVVVSWTASTDAP